MHAVRVKLSALRRRIYSKDLYFSQYGQDRYILEYFKNKTDGFFIDIGAFNGVTFSNTLKMENLGWKGICIEPNPEMFKKVCSTRKCAKYNVAIAENDSKRDFVQIKGHCAVLSGMKDDYHPDHIKRIEKELSKLGGSMETIKVETITFETLMTNFPDVKTIDYISIDTEGNEIKVLKSIDFSKYDIKALSIENDYNNAEIRELMKKSGYKCVIKLGCDEIYIKNNL